MHKPFADDRTWPPANFSHGSTFWKLGDGRSVWMNGDGQCRAASGIRIMPAFVQDGAAELSCEGAFRAAVAQEEFKPKARDCLTLPDGHRLTREELRRAHYSLPPVMTTPVAAESEPPWRKRALQLFPVLDAAGEEVGEVWFAWKQGQWHVGRTPFINSFEERLRYDECGKLAVAAVDKDWATLDAFHPELLPWFCRQCGCNYEEPAWCISERFEEDGWLDSYRGRCPEGHERMIAD